ncbi:MAG: hypothetical protein KBT75_05375 [Oleispira antarctica]|uniref:Uncharacterized protein n=1 Tax=Oleispira antarctica RB-8 TaxID=698738 RepID=R4YNF5_OLEAN|nr:hypothetical protein [Oleispira antarctica]MBQ0791656.1 hypothetical protein [Oleispira antarctica]CCK76586.1 hypothetical protein OLEAN_C24100 [Oleispira antarctica RB-8]
MKMEILGIAEVDVLVRMNGTHIVKIPLIGISEEHELIKHAAFYQLGLAQGILKKEVISLRDG